MRNKIGKIGVGTVQFGTRYGISNTSGRTPAAEVSKILDTAYQYHVTLLDTASAYGEAEKVLGMNDPARFQIVSKFLPPQKTETIRNQLMNSLHSLGVTSLYGYLAHRPEVLASHPEQWDELKSLRQKKRVQKIGFSLNRPEEFLQLSRCGYLPDIVQVPFSYFDRRFEPVMKKLKEKGCEIHARSVFLQGLFFVDTAKTDSYFDEVKPVIGTLQKTIRNLPGALLNFALKQPFIDRVIIGVENHQQLADNIRALASAEELPELQKEIPDHLLIPMNWPSTT
jgi:aryl-alcohol dehydrogenase-like predicted oxidoreductase